jgi:hypothetical protein
MAIVTNTLLTFSAIGNREDFSTRSSTSARPTFRFSRWRTRQPAKATLHEWQTETLTAAAANAQLQGDDVAFGAAILTTRVSNRTQISRKEVVVSGTQEAIDKAGRNSEMVRQMANKRAELMRDKEFVLCSNQAPVTGNSTTAPQLRPLHVVDCHEQRRRRRGQRHHFEHGPHGRHSAHPHGSVDGRPDAERVDQRRQALGPALCGPKQRGVISTFTAARPSSTRSRTRTWQGDHQVYEGDFGTLKIVPSRFVRGAAAGTDREVFLLDPALLAVAYVPGASSRRSTLPLPATPTRARS